MQATAQSQSNSEGFKLAWHFVDVPYNRTSFTFAGYRDDAVRFPAAVLVAVSRIARPAQAQALIARVASCPRQTKRMTCSLRGTLPSWLRTHVKSSTYVSTAPLILALALWTTFSWHPLGTGAAALAAAAEMATSVAAMLSQLVPDLSIHLYGAASSSGAKLRDVRRDCGAQAACAHLRCSLAPILRLAAGITSLASFAAAIIRRNHDVCVRNYFFVFEPLSAVRANAAQGTSDDQTRSSMKSGWAPSASPSAPRQLSGPPLCTRGTDFVLSERRPGL